MKISKWESECAVAGAKRHLVELGLGNLVKHVYVNKGGWPAMPVECRTEEEAYSVALAFFEGHFLVHPKAKFQNGILCYTCRPELEPKPTTKEPT